MELILRSIVKTGWSTVFNLLSVFKALRSAALPSYRRIIALTNFLITQGLQTLGQQAEKSPRALFCCPAKCLIVTILMP